MNDEVNLNWAATGAPDLRRWQPEPCLPRRDDAQDRDVAIKCSIRRSLDVHERRLSDSSSAKAREQHSDHPNIATIYEVVHEVGKPYVVMESVYNGRSLARHCESSVHRRTRRRCPHRTFVRQRYIMLINAASVTAIQTNFLDDVGPTGRFWILRDHQSHQEHSQAGHGGNGFNPYAAPERNADKRVGIGADIYSGYRLYELLAGRPLSKEVTACKTSTTNRRSKTHTGSPMSFRCTARVGDDPDRCLNRVPSDRYLRRCTSQPTWRLPRTSCR